MKDTAVYAFTRKGGDLGRFIADQVSADLYMPGRLAADFGAETYAEFGRFFEEMFFRYSSHIFVAATGIVVRAIAPLVRSKDRDPAVVVVDQKGRYCISLLSGHLGGANNLAKRLAKLIKGEAIITTATDIEGFTSIDILAMEKGMKISNLKALKGVNASILEGKPVHLYDAENRLGFKGNDLNQGNFIVLGDLSEQEPGAPGIVVTWQANEWKDYQLLLHPKCLVAGLGCNRGTGAEEITALVKEVFKMNNLSLHSLRAIATIEDKKEEKGLLKTAETLGASLLFFDKDEISMVRVPNPSYMVERHMGVRSVCEAAAIVGSKKGTLIVPKIKGKNITIAVALDFSGS